MRRFLVVFSVLLSLPLITLPASGLLIEVPLWERVENSQVIAFAHVLAVHKEPATPEEIEEARGLLSARDLEHFKAVLEVETFLKGRGPKLIVVEYLGNIHCPAPPGFEAGRDVTVFLNLIEGQWMPYGLARGTVYLEGREREDLHALIRSAVILQRARAGQEAYLDWLIEEILRPGTRDDGLETLEEHLRENPDGLEGEPGKEPLHLEERHLHRLAVGFAADPPKAWHLVQWLRILDTWPDATVDRLATDAIREGLKADRADYWITSAMLKVLERRGMDRGEAWKRVAAAIDQKQGDFDPVPLRALWQQVAPEP